MTKTCKSGFPDRLKSPPKRPFVAAPKVIFLYYLHLATFTRPNTSATHFWHDVTSKKRCIFIGGSFKISFCCLSARLNFIRFSLSFVVPWNRFWPPFWLPKSLQNRSKIALTRPKSPNTRSRSILKLPRASQELHFGLQNRSKTDPRSFAASKSSPDALKIRFWSSQDLPETPKSCLEGSKRLLVHILRTKNDRFPAVHSDECSLFIIQCSWC